MKEFLLNKLGIHALFIAAFILLAGFYFKPLFEGKEIVQSDLVQLKGVGKEYQEYKEKGETIYWTRTSFSGMPHWSSGETNLFSMVHEFFKSIMPRDFYIVFLLFLGMYVSIYGLSSNSYVAFGGALAYTFSTFNLISIEVGHVNKVYAMACMAPILTGIYLVYQKKLLYGLSIFVLFLGLQIYYNHLQITYYTVLAVGLMTVVEIVFALKNKTLLLFLKRSALLLVFGVLTILTNITTLWTMWDYQKSSNRGGTELTEKSLGEKPKNTEGLDKDYAFEYSYGLDESFNLLIAGFKGGANSEKLDEDSEAYQALIDNRVSKRQAQKIIENVPLYWGTQPYVAGPNYIGAISVFLFVFGLLTIRGKLKYWIAVATILAIIISWGKNLEWFSDFMFYYFPMFNKFRVVTMILSLVEVTLPLLGFVALAKAFEDNVNKDDLIKKLYIALGVTAGLCLFFYLFGSWFYDFEHPNDARYGFPEWLVDAIREDRAGRLGSDAIRSFGLIVVSGLLIWLSVKNVVKPQYAQIAIALLVVVDTWGVGLRYLNEDSFSKADRLTRSYFRPTQVDQQLLSDKSDYRVFNTTRGITQDGLTSYHHNSIGGYSAIKLGRYQELITHHIAKMNTKVFDMLNVKYFIVKQNEQLGVQKNPGALGNAWFVSNAIEASTADDELLALNEFDPAKDVVIRAEDLDGLSNKEFKKQGAKLEVVKIHPERMEYKSTTKEDAFAVFSEIYYQPGWQAYIDGESVSHYRVNYVLRGLEVPAGEHTIVFEFDPPSYSKGNVVSMITLVILLLVFGLVIYKRQKISELV